MAPDTLTVEAATLALGGTPAAVFNYAGYVYAFAVDGFTRTPIAAKTSYTLTDWFNFQDGAHNV